MRPSLQDVVLTGSPATPALVYTQWILSRPAPALERHAPTMIALGGDLYIYGGRDKSFADRSKRRDDSYILSDILVARGKNGYVNQPWKQFAFGESALF